MPFPQLAPDAAVSALPASPRVGVLDLLRAIDAAALAGDLHRVRSLVAAAVESVERATAAPERAVRPNERP